ncbi:MAG TPA: tetratricopeptide repeat protein [Blastocatellia bacterium]|nr:tetratricopeptide repeat protein [Blastocatellia bacterium]
MSLNKSKALRTAEKYALQGKIPAAIDEYRKVVSADPGDLTTVNTLGDLYVRAGRIQDAISNFSRIADSYREGGFTLKAIAMLKKISKLDPTNIETAMKLANLYSQQGLLVEARQQYLHVADAYARAGQTRKALEAYQKIADLDPSNTSVRMKLGEIYSREGMTEQAHEAFIMAGAEFLRKGDSEQALNANLKAIIINADSRQALTAIATIYTQQGQTDRAINLLCEAFERNPGDIELLTILGRTYLSAGMMDDAERTFLSLVELDRNRYHYLLEVGRRFLQIGDLDRAAEQIDGCIEVLIAKREEDKAIDFLRRVLDREMNHVGALKRLAEIYLRIREDHNLVATLNSLVEAAMRKGDDKEAITALKELARLEPDEPLHLQRLYNLGVSDIVESDSPDSVRATGPLDFRSAAFDDTFVIRQISEAEILAGHGQVSHAIEILTQILDHAPENVQVHLKLKDIYLRAGLMDKAASECLALSRIHEARGESARASDYVAEAHQLNPLITPDTDPVTESNAEHREWLDDRAGHFVNAIAADTPRSHADLHLGFDAGDSPGLDWSKYQTGTLSDHGFVTVPEDHGSSGNGLRPDNGAPHAESTDSSNFRYSDTLIGDSREVSSDRTHTADAVFTSASLLPSDTMPRVLRDELEGVDFYIAQGYAEIAHDTLERLREENGDHPEILARYKRLGASPELHIAEPVASRFEEPASWPTLEPEIEPGLEPEIEAGVPAVFPPVLPEDEAFLEAEADAPSFSAVSQEETPHHETASVEFAEAVAPHYEENATEFTEFDTPHYEEEPEELLQVETPAHEQHVVEAVPFEPEPSRKVTGPLLLQKESGALYPDLLVQFDTSELNRSHLDALHAAVPPPPPAPPVHATVETGDLIESIMSGLDTSFDAIHYPREESVFETSHSFTETSEDTTTAFEQDAVQEAEAVASIDSSETVQTLTEFDEPIQHFAEFAQEVRPPAEPSSARDELQEIFDELKEQTGDLKPLLDFETHYSLGLAYKDMDLLDDAISEFQMAFRTAGIQDLEGDYIHCCNMLGVCFKRKQMHKVAIMWFERGLKITGRAEDEYQALRFEIGLCYEEMGEIEKALESFTEVYGIDVNYRKVGEKIKQLQAAQIA